MKNFFTNNKATPPILIIDPDNGYIRGWHVNRFIGYETQMRHWLTQLKISTFGNTLAVESFLQALHLNREDHGWIFEKNIVSSYWGGQSLFVRNRKRTSVILGQYLDIKDRCNRFWPKVDLDEKSLDLIAKEASKNSMMAVAVAIRSVDTDDEKILLETPHTLVGVAVCEPHYFGKKIEELGEHLKKIKLITALDKGIVKDFCHQLGIDSQEVIDARTLSNRPEEWTKSIKQHQAISNVSEIDRFHIINYLSQIYTIKTLDQ